MLLLTEPAYDRHPSRAFRDCYRVALITEGQIGYRATGDFDYDSIFHIEPWWWDKIDLDRENKRRFDLSPEEVDLMEKKAIKRNKYVI